VGASPPPPRGGGGAAILPYIPRLRKQMLQKSGRIFLGLPDNLLSYVKKKKSYFTEKHVVFTLSSKNSYNFELFSKCIRDAGENITVTEKCLTK
jgi:hypothetical protein